MPRRQLQSNLKCSKNGCVSQNGDVIIPQPPRCRVARWLIFRPKIAIWVDFGRSCSGRCWCNLWTFGLFYGHLIFSMDIWYIFPPFWYIVPRKIWQPCRDARVSFKTEKAREKSSELLTAWMFERLRLMYSPFAQIQSITCDCLNFGGFGEKTFLTVCLFLWKLCNTVFIKSVETCMNISCTYTCGDG
jgi:hypothetical protein